MKGGEEAAGAADGDAVLGEGLDDHVEGLLQFGPAGGTCDGEGSAGASRCSHGFSGWEVDAGGLVVVAVGLATEGGRGAAVASLEDMRAGLPMSVITSPRGR